jgi:hypothetical protein
MSEPKLSSKKRNSQHVASRPKAASLEDEARLNLEREKAAREAGHRNFVWVHVFVQASIAGINGLNPTAKARELATLVVAELTERKLLPWAAAAIAATPCREVMVESTTDVQAR